MLNPLLKLAPIATELDIERTLGEHRARVAMTLSTGSRIQKMQDLLARIASLGEADFEVTFRAMEGVLQSTLVRRGESQKNKMKSEKAQELGREVDNVTNR